MPRKRRLDLPLLLLLAAALALRLWGIQDRLPDASLGINVLDDTAIEETDRTTMARAWSLWSGGAGPVDLNPHTGGWPSLSFYFTLGLQILYRGFSSLATGSFATADFIRHVTVRPDEFFLFCRILSALIGVLTVYLTVRLGDLVLGRSAGLGAGLLLVANPLHVTTSQHIGDPNMLALAFVLLAALFLPQIGGRQGVWSSVVSGAMIGLAGACKYAPLVVAIPFALAHREHGISSGGAPSDSQSRGLALGLLAIVAAFALATPYLLLDWRATVHDFGVQRRSLFSEWVGQSRFPISLPAYLVQTLPHVAGWPAYALSLLGMGILFHRGGKARILVLIPMAIIGANGLLRVAQDRYVLAALPFLLLAVIPAIEWGTAAVRGPAGAALSRRAAQVLLVALCAAWTLPGLVAFRRESALPDSRHLARRWINESIDPRSPMVVEAYGPVFSAARQERSALTWPFYATQASLVAAAYHPEWLDGFAYYVQSAGVWRRYRVDSTAYPAEIAYGRWLRERAPVVWRSDPAHTSGPPIEVRRLPDHISTPAQRDSLWARVAPSIKTKDGISRWCLVMGELFYLGNDLARAAEWARRGLSIAVPSTERQLRATLAPSLLQLNEPEAAEQEAAIAVARYPEDDQFHLYRAMALHQLGRTSQALTEYKESLRLKPGQAAADRIRAAVAVLEAGGR